MIAAVFFPAQADALVFDLDEGDAHVSFDGDRMETFMFDEIELLAPATTEPEAPPAVVRRRIEVLYRHPDESSLEWTGRGRKPKWVEAWIKKGGTLEQLLAKKRPAHKPKGGKAAACEAITPRCDKTLELPNVTTTDSQPSASAE